MALNQTFAIFAGKPFLRKQYSPLITTFIYFLTFSFHI